MRDPYQLERFLEAQAPVYQAVLSELAAGRKSGHWMWFVFPQARGLGLSPTSQRFAIRSIDEAKAYLEHPVLGRRLRECTWLVSRLDGVSARGILGSPDDMKLRSSMTLFALASGEEIFEEVLRKYFGGIRDLRTVELMRT